MSGKWPLYLSSWALSTTITTPTLFLSLLVTSWLQPFIVLPEVTLPVTLKSISLLTTSPTIISVLFSTVFRSSGDQPPSYRSAMRPLLSLKIVLGACFHHCTWKKLGNKKKPVLRDIIKDIYYNGRLMLHYIFYLFRLFWYFKHFGAV